MKTSFLTLALVLLIALPAFAQYAAVIHACSRDMTTLCPGNHSGQNRFDECVKLHFSDYRKVAKLRLHGSRQWSRLARLTFESNATQSSRGRVACSFASSGIFPR